MDDQVSDFRGESQAITAPESFIENETAPDSGSEREPNPVRNPASGTDPALAHAEDIGVIFHPHRNPQTAFDFRTQRVISHGRKVGRKDHPAPLLIDLSRNAEADPCDRTAKFPCRCHQSPAFVNQLLCGLCDAKGNIGGGLSSPQKVP